MHVAFAKKFPTQISYSWRAFSRQSKFEIGERVALSVRARFANGNVQLLLAFARSDHLAFHFLITGNAPVSET